MVTFGSDVARTPAESVTCGIARSVAVARGVGVGGGLVRVTAAVKRAVGAGVVGFGDGLGVGGSVGASVRNGGGAVGTLASLGRPGPPPPGSGSTTGGWSGAFGFFGCASA
jgi:hypothetical protein